jgi:iron(III) transport system substrate-binding protein
MSKLMTEHLAGKSDLDIIEISAYNLVLVQKKGLLMPYKSPEAEFFAKGLRNLADPEGNWYGVYTRPWVVGYNTRMVAAKDVPRRYEDLLNPMWKGKMMLDAYDFEWFLTQLQLMGEQKGLEFMKKLAAQDLDMRRGHSLEAQLVAAGEASILVVGHAHSIERLKKQGAPIDWAKFETIPAGLSALGGYARAPHPNAARLFIDFTLSSEGQKVLAENTSYNPVRPDFKQPWARSVNITVTSPALLGDKWDEGTKLYKEIFLQGKTVR